MQPPDEAGRLPQTAGLTANDGGIGMIYENRDDIQLMDCIQTRDERCLEQLHKRYHSMVFNLANTILRNHVHAEEVAQDIFLAIWQQPEKWQPEKGRFTSWLLTITRYTAIDRLRHEKRRPPLLESPLDRVSHLLSHTPVSDHDVQERAKLVRGLLKRLPEEQQQVIYLAFFQGMTHTQIANHLSLPLGTVKSRLRLGMGKLREDWLALRTKVTFLDIE